VSRTVELIYDFIRQSELLPRERFVDYLDGNVLLYKRWTLAKPDNGTTKTTQVTQPMRELSDVLADQKKKLVVEAHDYRVYRLPHRETTWVLGRAAENDLVFSHRSISKSHARLSTGADSSVLLADLGSKNGTWVENKRVLPDKPVLVWSKQSIRIGSLDVRFLSAQDFYESLGTLVITR
jgi:hypothetical protein